MEEKVGKALEVLFHDLSDHDQSNLPLIAHYTSYSVLESILTKEELWFSNPLFMNDFQEVRFGMLEGSQKVTDSDQIKELFRDEARTREFVSHFEGLHNKFAAEHVLNVYVLCFSEHDERDYDGRLSMWRGYGSNASGACIVFNPRKVPRVQGSPLIFSEITYATHEEQRAWLDNLIVRFCKAAESVKSCDKAPFYLAWYLFERIKLFSIFTKHKGFSEEKEWRLVYMPDRDEDRRFSHLIDYWSGPRGPEPKLKLELRSVPGFEEGIFSLENIVDRLIVGPTNSNPLSQAMMHRVLDKHKQNRLKDRMHGSTIPYRALGKAS